jgi:hypothetical protein
VRDPLSQNSSRSDWTGVLGTGGLFRAWRDFALLLEERENKSRTALLAQDGRNSVAGAAPGSGYRRTGGTELQNACVPPGKIALPILSILGRNSTQNLEMYAITMVFAVASSKLTHHQDNASYN